MEQTVRFKAGKYYIGDPCYAFNKTWGDFLHDTDYGNETIFRKKNILVGGTRYGDGIYRGSDGVGYWVDAGMIGILPISLLKIDNNISAKNAIKDNGASIVTFDNDSEASVDDGVFKFGNITIDTVNQSEDEEVCPHCGEPIHS